MEEKTVIIKQGSFGSFVRGMIVGAFVALLLAPRSGRETRDMLTEKGTEFKDKAVDIAKDTRVRAQGVISEAKTKVEDTVKNVKESDSETKDLRREADIMEDINNPNYSL